MEARFRIRTREGEELRPRTVEIFAEFVRSGVVRPEDLVYDALTGEWIPAGTHPMVRLMLDPLVSGWNGPARAPSAAVEPDPTLGGALDLVEAPVVSPEEEKQAFLARMEDERRADAEASMLSSVDEGPVVVDLSLPTSEASPGPGPESGPRGVSGPGPESQPEPRPRRRPMPYSSSAVEPVPEGRSWRRVGGLGLAAALSVSALAVFAAVARPSLRVGDHMPDLAEAPTVTTRAPRKLADTEEAVRGAAFDSFLASLDGLRDQLGVGAVPPEWLTGRYLADPTAYPEVRRYWERYLSYVEHARAEEVTMYREAYLDALDEAGAAGPVRSLRLATALQDFDAAGGTRGERYAHAWNLAAAALALHDTLVGLQGRIRYEPARGSRVSVDPVTEAVGTDPDAQLRLDSALDRVLDALQVNGGAVEPDSIPTWLASSLRDARGGAALKP